MKNYDLSPDRESLHHRLGIAAGRLDKIARRIRLEKDDGRVYRRLVAYTVTYLNRIVRSLNEENNPNTLMKETEK